jgi:hypothetical protein
MPFIPVPGGIQAELRFLLDEQRIENTLWFQDANPGDPVVRTSIASMLITWWNSGLKTISSNQLSLVEVYVTDMSSQTGGVTSYTVGLPLTGGAIEAAAPNQCAMVVSLRTGARGRTARGRNYVAGLPNSQLVSNSWSTGYVGAIATEYNDLIAAATANGTPLCVCSRYENNAPRAAGILRQVLNAVVVDPIVDSQRRRTPGRGQ